jgi:hypothetical protein
MSYIRQTLLTQPGSPGSSYVESSHGGSGLYLYKLAPVALCLPYVVAAEIGAV